MRTILKKCIILANGKPPKKSVINFLQKKDYSTLFCADGGANSAKKLGLIPQFIIGDLDSVLPETLDYFKEKSAIIKLERQNDTDVEKCLKTAVNMRFTEAVLTGVTGDRLDHTFCNLGIALKYFNEIIIKIIAENSLLIPYKGSVELNTIPGEIVSLYGFDLKTKITSDGLKYKLKDSTLPFGQRESTSNVSVGDKVNLKIKDGIIFVIRDFNVMKKNNLF
jgi:thiamine pyrophosphokinase